MGKIKVLDDNTINQIAAGEVIENSASVLKELLENSRDAGAKQIKVETKGGGRLLMRVSDDGVGMGEEDVLLAPQRHATSKIQTADDLTTLQTLGFRGEALASIAAVSKMVIHTCDQHQATLLTLVGGRVEQVGSKARQRGTTIEVRDLFYNVPARLAFQKSIASDTANLSKVMNQFALSAPEVGLVWWHDGKIELELLPYQTLQLRIHHVLGEAYARELVPVGTIGLIGRLSAHRPNRMGQYLIINGRPVDCPAISRMVLESYGTRLPPRRFPLFVLHLTLPTESIDVNVHPQKREIRLRDEKEIAALIQPPIAHHFERQQPLFSRPVFQMEPPTYAVAEEVVTYRVEKGVVEPPPLLTPLPTPVGLFAHFLLLEKEGKLQLIDLHRATYRIRFEQMGDQKDHQALLLPYTIDVSEEEKLFLLEREQLLLECGITIRHFGGTTFLIEAIPSWMETSEIGSFLHDLIDKGEGNCSKLLAKRGKKQVYRLEEAMHLLRKLMECDCPETTPDGEPIAAVLTREELNEKFR